MVLIKLSGACSGCPSSGVTLKNGVEKVLLHYVPEVIAVMHVEDEEARIPSPPPNLPPSDPFVVGSSWSEAVRTTGRETGRKGMKTELNLFPVRVPQNQIGLALGREWSGLYWSIL